MSLLYTCLFSCLVFTVLVLFIYYFFYFKKFTKYNDAPLNGYEPPVSVVICARNDKEYLAQYLPVLMNQEYPNFEVILMNDCSWDGTKDFLKELATQYKNLRIHNLEEENLYKHDKKFPLTLGIKSAENELLIFTDADCYPKSNYWLKEMVHHYQQEQVEVIIGYGAYQKAKGLLNKLIRFDTFMAAFMYFSKALRGNVYMATGRNLTYRRSLFFKNKGFATHNHIRSGDDDLFVNRVTTKTNYKIRIGIESHTVSMPKKSLMAWFNQKRRHVSTSKYYKIGDKLYLGIYNVFILLFFALTTALCFVNTQLIYIPIFILIVKSLVQIYVFKKSLEKLDEKDLLFWIPFCELFLLLFYACVQFINLIAKEPKWK